MQRLLYTFLTGVVIIGLIDSCVYHELPDYVCNDPDISYNLQVDPIITTKCAVKDCHNGDNGDEKDWTDFSKFQAKAQSGEVKDFVLGGIMPPGDTKAGFLTQEQINTLVCWIDQGAQDN